MSFERKYLDTKTETAMDIGESKCDDMRSLHTENVSERKNVSNAAPVSVRSVGIWMEDKRGAFSRGR